jgi:hypothetical protein
MSLTKDILLNAWKVLNIAIMQGTQRIREARYRSRFLPFLLSASNTGGMYNLREVRDTLAGASAAQGKSGYEAVIEWSPYLSLDAGNVSEKGDYCSTDGLQSEKKIRAYELNKFTGKRYKFDRNIELCKDGDLQMAFAQHLANAFEHAYTSLGIAVEAEYFGIIQNSPRKYRYIGGLPPLFVGDVRYAGEDLPLFQVSESKINVAGEGKFRQDKQRIGLMNPVLFGGFKLGEYARLKGISGLGDNGYNAAQMSEIDAASYLFSDQIETNTGLDSPMLALSRGAVQFVSYARYANRPESTSKVTRTTVRDPYVGLEWDLITTIEDCGAETVTYTQVEINWGLIVNPDCDPNDKNSFGTNGALLYNIVCSDDTICDIPAGKAMYQPQINDLEKCETPDEICAPTCNVVINPFIDGDDYNATANVVTSLGAAISSFAWTLNGTPLVAATQTITLDNTELADGDVIAVTVTDSLGCVATNSIEVSNGCPNPVYILDTNQGSPQTVVSGQTVNLGSFAAPVGALQIVLGVANTNDVPLVVTSGTATGTGAGGVVSDFPATLDNGDEGAIDSAASVKTVGAKQIVFTIASNDCDTPTFTLTVNYTITA